MLSLGISSLLAPAVERYAPELRRPLLMTLAGMLALVLFFAGSVFGRDWYKQWNETRRPLPPAGSPNVLLIVLDTVRADRTSLYGYGRPTTPTLERLALRAIRFDEARASAPWTLASHASMFTGRWPFELGIKWLAPMGDRFPTLAEYLGSRGYATAGFVANTFYCSFDTGLNRGFTHYEDYDLDRLGAFRTAELVSLTVKIVGALCQRLGETFDLGPFRALQTYAVGQLEVADKKFAGAVNREFLDWLSRRREPDRPFFAFLNYFDAHSRYLLPRGEEYRFGLKPLIQADFQLFHGWYEIDKTQLPRRYRTMISDCYDSCLAHLDERLGELFDELQSRGVLDKTLVVITSDHGEDVGEHDLYDHGESLYRNEIRVPLLIIVPGRGSHRGTVGETVSLRDLPATITDLTGLTHGSPFPGQSLSKYWRGRAGSASGATGEALSELVGSNPANPNQGRSPAARGALASLAGGDFVYIRNEGTGAEELFDERTDPRELINRAHAGPMQSLVQRFRTRLDQMRPISRQASR